MRWISLAALLALSLPAEAGRLERALDRYARGRVPADGPGATVIVVKDGAVLLREGYGMADLELALPMEPEHVLRIGSVTKQFTAAGILLLQQDGALSVDDPLTRFLPDYPTHGHVLTLRHLLNHTSGIFDYTDDWDYMSGPGIRRDLDTDALIEVFAHRPMHFAPGAAHAYSNSGYVLLGAVLEEASGQPWHGLLAERIFEPLGMDHTGAEGALGLHPGRVRGYQRDGEGWRNADFLSMTQPHAAGALLSTVDDLATWSAALDGDALLSEASKQAMWTGHAAEGEPVPYGFGWDLDPLRGRAARSHRGGVNGFSAKVIRVPDEGLFVAVLSNQGDPDRTGHLADGLAALALGDPYPTFEAVEVDPAQLLAVGGSYAVGEGEERLVRPDGEGGLVTVRGRGRPMRAVPHGPHAFHYPDTFQWFDFVVEAGDVVAMRMHDGDAEPVVAPRLRGLPEPVAVPVETLRRYVGRYALRPGFALRVVLQGERLAVQAPEQEPVPLSPSSPTAFFTPEYDAFLHFSEDGSALRLVEDGREHPAARVP